MKDIILPVTALFGALLVVSSHCVCQDSVAEAKAEFDRGVELYKAGSYKKAAEAFRHADALKPTWSLLFNIAQSEAAAKNYGPAYEAFEEYLAKGGDDLTAARRKTVIEEIDNLKNFIGSLKIEAPAGATVTVDGIDRGTAPLPGMLKIAVGMIHTVEIQHEGEVLLSENVKVSQGETVSVDAAASRPKDRRDETPPEAAEEIPIDESNETAAEDTGTSKLRPLGWAGIGVGASMLVAAAATGGVALSVKNDLDDKCTGGVCPAGDRDRKETKDALAISTDVLLGVGAAVTAVGIGLLIYSARSVKNEEQHKVSLMPVIGGTSAAIAVSGRF